MWKSAVSALLGLAILGAADNARGAEQSFTVVNIEYEGSTVFVPATLVVHQGDHVKIRS